jgi:hypothetical protein
VVVLLVVLIAMIAEVGFAFVRSSLITHAARDGARFGATLPLNSAGDTLRDSTTKCFTGDGEQVIEDHVDTALGEVGLISETAVSVTQNDCADGETPTITVQVTGTLQGLFGLNKVFGISDSETWEVGRTVTFTDELRVCPSNCS